MLKREEYEIGLIYFWVIGKEKGQAREGVLQIEKGILFVIGQWKKL